MTPADHPCTCWAMPVALHDGHCCMSPDAPEDCHRAEGLATWEATR